MRFLRERRALYGVLALIMIAFVVVALRQPQLNSSGRCDTAIPPEEDVQNALAYGHAFSEDTWELFYADHEGESISARWVDETAIGHLDYLRYNCGLSRESLDHYGFEISLSGYESWTETAKCEVDGIRLHEFDVVYDGQPYRTRFWLEPVNDTRLAAFQLSFPAARQSDLDVYSARLYPQLAACEG